MFRTELYGVIYTVICLSVQGLSIKRLAKSYRRSNTAMTRRSLSGIACQVVEVIRQQTGVFHIGTSGAVMIDLLGSPASAFRQADVHHIRVPASFGNIPQQFLCRFSRGPQVRIAFLLCPNL